MFLMIIFNLFMDMLIIMSSDFMLISLISLLMKEMIFIECTIFSLNSCNMSFIIFIDWIMLMFISVVMLISSMVMSYSKEYMYVD